MLYVQRKQNLCLSYFCHFLVKGKITLKKRGRIAKSVFCLLNEQPYAISDCRTYHSAIWALPYRDCNDRRCP
ncbi:hypothetical protein DP157_00875 [Klebsiella michiganensis]|nr:hypothetical protein [Klebsiella michiganensis]MBX4658987.1 hypothetical protein [Klebsiella michiganensis]MBX4795734.1 hypothetical protein [Klebsiella michiganensis]RMC96084.1 hypothetical protein EBH72_02140 [Klebsiella michiganensis]TXV06556.1 hypothetical protein D4M92_09670 [Klebsiella michiganensis]